MIIGGGPLFTFGESNLCLACGGIRIHDGLVTEIASFQDLKEKYPEEGIYDTKGKTILPGMTCAHHHLYSTFARGISLPGDPPATFGKILEQLWWRLDKVLTLDDVYLSALIALIECIRSGTTAILDHHASPFAVRGSLQAIARAVEQAGIRACLCYEVSDRDGPEIAEEGISENADFIGYTQWQCSDFLKGTFGLHASLTLSDETLRAALAFARPLKVGFHIHAAEGPEDVADSLRRSGRRVIERLDDLEILGEKTLVAHAVHVDDHEIELLARSGTMVAHNASSNMNNAVGFAPIPRLLEAGIPVGIGTDGMTSDLFSELRTAFLLEKHALADPRRGWVEVSKMFGNNTAIFSKYFDHAVGTLVPGGYADLIVLDYHPPTPFDGDTFLGHLFFALSSRMVDSTIVGGRFLMKERQLLVLDEASLAVAARELSVKLWQRF